MCCSSLYTRASPSRSLTLPPLPPPYPPTSFDTPSSLSLFLSAPLTIVAHLSPALLWPPTLFNHLPTHPRNQRFHTLCLATALLTLSLHHSLTSLPPSRAPLSCTFRHFRGPRHPLRALHVPATLRTLTARPLHPNTLPPHSPPRSTQRIASTSLSSTPRPSVKSSPPPWLSLHRL